MIPPTRGAAGLPSLGRGLWRELRSREAGSTERRSPGPRRARQVRSLALLKVARHLVGDCLWERVAGQPLNS